MRIALLVGNQLINAIATSFGCGSYSMQVPSEILDCYTVVFDPGINFGGGITLTESDLISGNYLFNYNINSNYSASVTLHGQNGAKCYFNKRLLIVQCFPDIIKGEKINAYPNPFLDKFSIENSSKNGI